MIFCIFDISGDEMPVNGRQTETSTTVVDRGGLCYVIDMAQYITCSMSWRQTFGNILE